jgi:hypothetical protein
MFSIRPLMYTYRPPVAWVAALILALVIALPTAAAGSVPLLVDDGFYVAGGGPTYSSIIAAPTPTAAPGWLAWNNEPVTTSTELLPTTLPGHTGWMLHVTVVGTSMAQGSGVYRPYAAVDTGPMRVRALVWVYVLTGRVGVGTGNGGNTGIDAATATTGRWELLAASNGVAPANEIIIYALDQSADFSVGAVNVETIGP